MGQNSDTKSNEEFNLSDKIYMSESGGIDSKVIDLDDVKEFLRLLTKGNQCEINGELVYIIKKDKFEELVGDKLK